MALARLVLVVGLSACDDEKEEVEDPDTPPSDPEFPGIGSDEPIEPLATPCSYADGTVEIVVEGSEWAIVSLADDLETILVNGLPCGDATKWNVIAIHISEDGKGGSQSAALDFHNGLFATATAEGDGVSVNLGAGADEITVSGTSRDDSFTAGADGLELNEDDVLDVTLRAVESLVITLGPGKDTFTALGGDSTGDALTLGLTVFGGSGDDDLTGGNGNDVVWAGPDNDRLNGGLGDDDLNGEGGDDRFLEGEAANGSDSFRGGAGADTVDYDDRRDSGVTVTLDDQADDGATGKGENDNVGLDVENARGSGVRADVITGSRFANVLAGGGGADRLSGAGGDDTLIGEAGNDTFMEDDRANGGDTFNGGDGVDTVDYSRRSDYGVTVTMDGQEDDGATDHGEGDNVQPDVENVIGSDLDDFISGNASANLLLGGYGEDTLEGLDGDDRFDEGPDANGADAILGGSGIDVVSYRERTHDLTITLGGGPPNDGERREGDDLGPDIEDLECGSGNDVATGDRHDNAMSGGDGDDTLYGRSGADFLNGDAGDDTLVGAEGDDILDGGGGVNVLDCGPGADIALNGSGLNCEL